MLSNADWPETIHALLRGGDRERKMARATLQRDVDDYVVRVASLSACAWGYRDAVRREISRRVLSVLERNDYAHVREWERRQLYGQDAAEWWSFIQLVAAHQAVAYERAAHHDGACRPRSDRRTG